MFPGIAWIWKGIAATFEALCCSFADIALSIAFSLQIDVPAVSYFSFTAPSMVSVQVKRIGLAHEGVEGVICFLSIWVYKWPN